MPIARDANGRFVSATTPPTPQYTRGAWARITGDRSFGWEHGIPLGTIVRLVESYESRIGYRENMDPWGVTLTPYADPIGETYRWIVRDELELLPSNPECPIGCPIGGVGCHRCLPNVFRLCARNRHLIERGGERCHECEIRCDACHGWEDRNVVRRVYFHDQTAGYVCRDCYGDLAFCAECDRWSRPDETHRCPTAHDCDICDQGPHRAGVRVIDNYSYAPSLRFYGDGPLYFGVEMEMEIPRPHRPETVARHLLNAAGRSVFAKSDGSLNRGIELVTQPMSFDYAMGHDRLWDALDYIRREWNVDNTSQAGLHVHVSRAGLSGPRHVYRWIKFFHRNRADIVRIARRESDQWAAFNHNQREWAAHIAKYGQEASRTQPRGEWYANRKDCYGWNDEGRYRAINNTNEDTLEVRVFAGSVYPEEIRAAIQLVHASIEYTRAAPTKKLVKSRYGWETFIGDYVSNRSDMYADLLRLNSSLGAPDTYDDDDDDQSHEWCAGCNSCECNCTCGSDPEF